MDSAIQTRKKRIRGGDWLRRAVYPPRPRGTREAKDILNGDIENTRGPRRDGVLLIEKGCAPEY